MSHIQFIHWNASEGARCAELLRMEGFNVIFEVPTGIDFLRKLRENLPAAVVIDLSRLPSQGRDFAMGIRAQKSTRYLPLVFVGGDPDKVERIRDKLPDAVFSTWNRIGSMLKQAIANPPAQPVAPKSIMDGYAGQPLLKKLGIKANTKVGLVNAPPDFLQTIGELPQGASFQDGIERGCELLIWFIRSRAELTQSIITINSRHDFRSIWFAWPKRAAGIQTDLTQQIVREAGLDAGLVDYKICSIDATWSGLLFAWRKAGKE